MDDQTKVNIAAGEAFATSVAAPLGPVPAAAVSAAIALLNAVTAKGNGMTIDDFKAAVLLDDAAVADDLKAQQESAAPG